MDESRRLVRLRAYLGRPWVWPAVLVLSALVILVFMYGNLAGPARAWAAGWFLLVCPGMALVRLLRLGDRIAEWTLAIGLSLALGGAVAGSMLYLRAWSPERGLALLAGVTVAGALLQLEAAYGRVAGSLAALRRGQMALRSGRLNQSLIVVRRLWHVVAIGLALALLLAALWQLGIQSRRSAYAKYIDLEAVRKEVPTQMSIVPPSRPGSTTLRLPPTGAVLGKPAVHRRQLLSLPLVPIVRPRADKPVAWRTNPSVLIHHDRHDH